MKNVNDKKFKQADEGPKYYHLTISASTTIFKKVHFRKPPGIHMGLMHPHRYGLNSSNSRKPLYPLLSAQSTPEMFM